jgi:trehalose synthase
VAKLIEVGTHIGLEGYASVGHLAPSVMELRVEAERIARSLAGRTVWMISSTAQGGGVAEMLPAMITLLRELGVATEWLVIESDRPEFFALTKRIHNLIHGEGEPTLSEEDRQLYERVSRENAEAIRPRLGEHDILAVHDPQPLYTGALLKEELGLRSIWRCHIGLDARNAATDAAWEFLRPYAAVYDHAIFSVPEYIPGFLAGRATIIHPALDPLGHKNRPLNLHKLVGILCDSSLAVAHWPLVSPAFQEPAMRLQSDGAWAPATEPEDIGLLARPIITQVSRWDRLKGFAPLLEAFRRLKLRANGARAEYPARDRRFLDIARLVLAGPDPLSVQDDPEGLEVLEALRAQFCDLEPEVQRDVAFLTLPMKSRKDNALMVNVIQRASTIVVQNSIREGFGLTVAEAMWKHIPVLGNSKAAGIRQQIRDGIDGVLIEDPEDAEALSLALESMLVQEKRRDDWGRSAQKRAHDEFLIFTQIRRWLRVLAHR